MLCSVQNMRIYDLSYNYVLYFDILNHHYYQNTSYNIIKENALSYRVSINFLQLLTNKYNCAINL